MSLAPPQRCVQITVTPGSLPAQDTVFNATALGTTCKRSFLGLWLLASQGAVL